MPTRPFADWRTVETANFTVHYPHEMAEWTLPLVSRLESVHEAVSDLVGNAPRGRITVMVTDPFNVANGFALPFLNTPSIVLWPTPPDPRSGIGHHVGWSDLLATHEYAHIAHLTFPNRNPRQRMLWRLLPVNLGPIARRAPRWVTEGYATYIEGELTGSGRPYGVYRPAVLRQWAIEGKLPTYQELSGSRDFLGGSMAYLAGSAFLAWLVGQSGEESLNHLWRRLSARRARSFSAAFTGVYGGRPEDLYGRFTVEVTRQAIAAREALEAAGLVDGATVQARRWSTGEPTVSDDGTRIALVLGSRDHPSRVVVWRTEEEPETEAEIEARERALRLDPEDVPAFDWRPLPKEPLAVLEPVDGRTHHSPRFLPGGRWILVTRSEPLGDGTYRPDLFLWDWEVDELHRVTHGAGIRDVDPSPAGRTAVGVRCLDGICDLVRIDLETGAIDVLHHGLPGRVFYRPRYSPNGRQVVVAVQENGRWRLALTDEDGAPLRFLNPGDGASRYDATFLPEGGALVTVSEAGGVPNLEIIDLESGEIRPLTRVTSAAMAPEPNPANGSVYFLKLHAEGIDLNRISPDSVTLETTVALAPALWPAAPAPGPAIVDTFETATVSRPRAYGVGPERFRFLAGGTLAPEGKALLAAVVRTDPVGRLTWVVQGVYGDPELWNGGGVSMAWRRFRPTIQADLFFARQEPSWRLVTEGDTAAPLNVEYAGGTLLTEITRDFGAQRHRYRLGGSAGRLDGSIFASEWRQLIFAEYQGTALQIEDNRYFAPSFGIYGALGRTGDTGWSRLIGTLSLDAGIRGLALLTELTYGTTQEEAGPFEQFVAGGTRPLFFDDAILAQRFHMPAVPPGVVTGSQIMMASATATFGPLYPYFWAATTDEIFKEWFRVVGVQRELNLAPIPLGRLPGIRAAAGVAFILDEPLRHEVRAYLTIGYRP